MSSIEYTTEEIKRLADLIREYYRKISELPAEKRQPMQIEFEKLNLDLFSFPALGLSNPVGQIADFIAQQLQDLLKGIQNILASMLKPIGDAISSIGTVILNIQGGVANVLTGLSNLAIQVSQLPATIANAFSWVGDLVNALQNAINALLSLPDVFKQIVNAISQIPQFLQQIGSGILNALASIPMLLRDFSNVITTIPNVLQQIGSGIANALLSLPDVFRQFASITAQIPNVLQQVATGFVNALSTIPGLFKELANLLATIPTALGQLGQAITNVLMQLPGTLQQIASFIASIIGNIPNLFQQFTNVLTNIPNIFANALSQVAHLITNIPNLLAQIGSAIAGGFQQFISFLQQIGNLFTSIPGVLSNLIGSFINVFIDTSNRIGSFISSAINAIATIPNLITSLISQLQIFIGRIPVDFQRLIDTVKSAIEGVANIVKSIPEIPIIILNKIKEILPPDLANRFEVILANVIKCLDEPWKCLVTVSIQVINKIAEYIKEGAQYIFGLVKQGISFATEMFSNIFNTLYGAINNFVSGLLKMFVDSVVNFGNWLIGVFRQIAERLIDLFNKLLPIGKIFETLPMAMPFSLMATRSAIGEAFKTIESVFTSVYGRIALPFMLARLISSGTITLDVLAALCKKVEIDVAPAEMGVKYSVGCKELFKAFGGFVKNVFLAEIKEAFKYIHRGFFEFLGFAVSMQSLRVINYALVDYIGNILPYFNFSLSEAADLHRRIVVFQNIEDPSRISTPEGKIDYKTVYDKLETVLKMEGFPFYIRKFAIGKVDDFYVTVFDRFGNPRKVPISQGYEIPSPSEITRMMIRDMFNSPEDFFAMGGVRGMYKDVLLQYYLFHFRYPSPEKIVEFYMRGLAGNLFSSKIAIELDEIESRWLEQLKAPKPVAPADLMNQPNVLADILKTYLRWHDYFYAAWKQGFTSDRAITYETIFDLPLRVDVRWLYKWSVFSGIAMKHGFAKLQELAPKMFGPYTTAQAFATFTADNPEAFDVLQLGRIAVARALHPEWVPFVTLSEALEVITDERTIVRTDVMNVYEWGFYDINKVANIFSNLMEVYYKVPVYDETNNIFKQTDIVVPIKYRETEIKMLGIRSITKRYLDFAREFIRDLEYAYRENIVPTKEEIQRKITIDDIINEVTKAVTGKVSEEDIKLISETIRSRSKELEFLLSFEERQAKALELVQEVISTVNESIKKELELLNKDAKSAKVIADLTAVLDPNYWTAKFKLFEIDRAKRIYERMRLWMYWMIWSYFIYMQQGLVDYRTAIERIVDIMTSLKLTDVELRFLLRYATDVLTGAQRGKAPTPSQLATFADALAFGKNIIEEVLDIQNVKIPQIRQLWTAYIAIRPFLSELNSLRTALITAYVNGAIKKWEDVENTLKQVETEVKKALDIPEEAKQLITVFSSTTLRILREIAEARRKNRYEPETLLTPSNAITFLEYVPEAWHKLVEEMKGIKMAPIFREFWDIYVKRRVTRSAYNRLVTEWLNAYEVGVITPQENEQIVKMLKENGFYDEELNVYKLIAELRGRRRFGFTIAQLEQILEYVPEAYDHVVKTAQTIIRDPVLSNITQQYLYRRSIATEVNRYISSAFAYLSRVLDVKDPEIKKLYEALNAIGTSTEELKWVEATLEVRRRQFVLNTLVPSLNSLIANSRYAPVAKKLYAWKLEKELDIETVAQLFGSEVANMIRDYYMQIMTNRAVATEINALVAQYRNLVSYDMLTPDIENEVVQLLTQYGVQKDRLDLIKLQAQLARLSRIGATKETYTRFTITRLTQLIERVPEARDIALAYLQQLNLDPRLYNIYLKYIDASVGLSELRRFLTYFHTLFSTIRLTAEDRKQFETIVTPFGYVGKRLDLYYKSLQLRRIRYILATLIPSLTALTAYTRYTDRAFDLLKFKMSYFIDKNELVELFGNTVGTQLYQMLIDFFTQMAIARAVRTELSNAITALVNAYSIGAITTQQFEQELENLKKFGLSDMQIELIKLRAKYMAIYRTGLRGARG